MENVKSWKGTKTTHQYGTTMHRVRQEVNLRVIEFDTHIFSVI